MSNKVFKLLSVFSWIIILVLLVLNITLGQALCFLKQSPMSGVNMNDVYNSYIDDLK